MNLEKNTTYYHPAYADAYYDRTYTWNGEEYVVMYVPKDNVDTAKANGVCTIGYLGSEYEPKVWAAKDIDKWFSTTPFTKKVEKTEKGRITREDDGSVKGHTEPGRITKE